MCKHLLPGSPSQITSEKMMHVCDNEVDHQHLKMITQFKVEAEQVFSIFTLAPVSTPLLNALLPFLGRIWSLLGSMGAICICANSKAKPS